MTEPNNHKRYLHGTCGVCGFDGMLGEAAYRAHDCRAELTKQIKAELVRHAAKQDGSALPEGLGLVLDTMRLALNWAETEGEKPVQMDFKSAETLYTAARLLQQSALSSIKSLPQADGAALVEERDRYRKALKEIERMGTQEIWEGVGDGEDAGCACTGVDLTKEAQIAHAALRTKTGEPGQ